MEEKKNPYVFIYEPVLEERKSISALFPLKSFLPKFFDDLEGILREFSKTPAHIILFNLDKNFAEVENFFKTNGSIFPKEVVLLGMSKNPDSPRVQKLKIYNFKDIYEYPLSGMKVKPHITSISRNISEFKYEFKNPLKVNAEFSTKVLALGETNIILEGNLIMHPGYKISLKSKILSTVLKGKLSLVVSQNRHEFILSNNKAMTLTMLGLNNTDLQSIRSEVLQWEKL